MDRWTSPITLSRALTAIEGSEPDRAAVEALVAAMHGWQADQLADYRAAVLDEVAGLRGRPVRGFLAVEVLALVSAGEHRPLP